ncbi:MAG: cation:dicarboxylase symporter family transporter [Deltaproteobacteria bacterium]|nr:cation:dicarboxylase symporter family transporter [Deltaproteobacteria bacterium]
MAEKKTRRFSLSTNILIGMFLGITCGIFFGEKVAFLQVAGNAFIKLLQMTILPYILASLINGIGGLTYNQAKELAKKGGVLMLLFWAIAFAMIFLVPLSFPTWESSAFFSTSLVETPPMVDFLSLYIPSNPFYSLANNIVPAVVLFSILLGVALIGIKDKEILLKSLATISEALVRITGMIVKLTPLGVFAISAAAAGTMTIEQFGRLQVYLVSFNLAVLLLTFGVLPLLVIPVTPFKYRDIVGMSKDALVTAFTTGNLFVVLTVLTDNCKKIFDKYDLKREKTGTYIDVLIPISFNFPNIGKLIMLVFVLFAVWFSGGSLNLGQYGTFLFSGLLSFFGGVDVALPFMLDLMRLPSDMYQLYVVTGVINGRSSTLLAAMNLLVFTMLTTASLTGTMKVNKRKILVCALGSLALTVVVILGSRLYFSAVVQNVYQKDVVVANMQLLHNPAPYRLYREISEIKIDPKLSKMTPMERINKTGTIRVGYDPNQMPFAYFNTVGELVGFDIGLAHKLANDFEWNIEFIPIDRENLAEELKTGRYDIVMSGFAMTPAKLDQMAFSDPYLNTTAALIVEDFRKDEFDTIDKVRQHKKLQIAIPGRDRNLRKGLKEFYPNAEVVMLDNPIDFFEKNFPNLDAMMWTAEGGSAWTLLYPKFHAVVIKPETHKIPFAYPIAQGDQVLADIINKWIYLVKDSPGYNRKYDYWILGVGAEEMKPRWSIARDVLGWWPDEEEKKEANTTDENKE